MSAKNTHGLKKAATGSSEVRVEEKFEYFMERTAQDLRSINEKLDQLWSFRMMLLGAAMSISVIFSGLTTLFVIYLKK